MREWIGSAWSFVIVASVNITCLGMVQAASVDPPEPGPGSATSPRPTLGSDSGINRGAAGLKALAPTEAEAHARTDASIWQPIDGGTLARRPPDAPELPRAYRLYRLDTAELRRVLDRAPSESDAASRAEKVVLALPTPEGGIARFAIQESSIMEPGLAAACPEIKTVSAQGVDDPTATGRFDWTERGFNALVLSSAGAYQVTPFAPGETTDYLVYDARDAMRDSRAGCLVRSEPGSNDGDRRERGAGADDVTGIVPPSGSRSVLTPVGPTLRTYRLAIAATGEYTSLVGGGVSGALASIVTTINGVNAIYERQFAIRFVLVGNETSIIYGDGSTDPYTEGCQQCVLTENQSNLDAVIGTANYDVSQVYVSCSGIRGYGTFGSACNPAIKAMGTSNPCDWSAVWLASHELGHQFGCGHTFNGTTDGCTQSERSNSVAYEPGSGSTMMSYAGFCGAENVQIHQDLYFASGNYNQVVAFVTTGGGTCGAQSSTGNSSPTISAGPDYTIPVRTPFTLTAFGSDTDGDSLTYGWEELDLGTPSPPSTDDGSRPIFRAFADRATPSRTFPQLSDILSGVPTFGESLALTSRTMTFEVAGYDNRAGGGGANVDTMLLTTSAFAGPFQVTDPNAPVSIPGNSLFRVTWEVAGTAAPPVSTANVKISLSSDGGQTFPTILAASTPNDGEEWVTIPNAPTSAARIKVEAVGNVYFDISGANATIVSDPIAPHFALSSVSVVPVGGDGDGFVEPGEAVRLVVSLRNVGTADAAGVSATLFSSTPGVTVVTSGAVSYPALAAGASGANPAGFLVMLPTGLPCGQDLHFQITTASTPGSDASTVPFTIGTGEPVVDIVPYTAPAVAIPDSNPAGISVPLTVSGLSGPIRDLDFSFDGTSCSPSVTSTTVGVTHSAVGDLVAELTSPVSTQVIVLDRPGGAANTGNNFCQTRLDDASTSPIQSIASGGAPWVGTFRPKNPLAAFRGEDPNGVWTLRISDLKPSDTGTLRRFSLRITHPVCNAPSPDPGEAAAAPPSDPLTVTESAGQLTLSWGASCRPTGADYAVYQGMIGAWYSHEPIFCSTQGETTKSFTAPAGSVYFLVVPQSSQYEGSYGRRSSGAEIPPASGACRSQLLSACP